VLLHTGHGCDPSALVYIDNMAFPGWLKLVAAFDSRLHGALSVVTT
jgi:hypothetical protein